MNKCMLCLNEPCLYLEFDTCPETCKYLVSVKSVLKPEPNQICLHCGALFERKVETITEPDFFTGTYPNGFKIKEPLNTITEKTFIECPICHNRQIISCKNVG